MRRCVPVRVAFLRPLKGVGGNAVRQRRRLDGGFEMTAGRSGFSARRTHSLRQFSRRDGGLGRGTSRRDRSQGRNASAGICGKPHSSRQAGLLASKLPIIGTRTVAEVQAALAAYEALLPKLSAMGITTVFDAGTPGDTLLNNALKALAGMERDGKLPLRYRASVYTDKRGVNGEEVARNIQQKRRFFASSLVDIHTAKIARQSH